MKNSEKQLVGVAMVAAGLYLAISFALPQLDTFNTNNTKATTLKADLQSSQATKENLALQISLLEKNIDIPADIQVKTFTNDTEEQATKELLDHVVNLATGSGNKFISLQPATVEPFFKPKPKEVPKDANGNPIPPTTATATPPMPDSSTGDPKADALAQAEGNLPMLVTKGYELTVRGTYSSLQAFLRAMDKQTMVLDMLNFDLENEIADATANAAASTGDPSLPLRLKVTLRLALQRVENFK